MHRPRRRSQRLSARAAIGDPVARTIRINRLADRLLASAERAIYRTAAAKPIAEELDRVPLVADEGRIGTDRGWIERSICSQLPTLRIASPSRTHK
jgi:hypothetical protein